MLQFPALRPPGCRLARPALQARSIAVRADARGGPTQLLDRFWLARGVQDGGASVGGLVQAGLQAAAAAPMPAGAPAGPVSLPGASSAWLLDEDGGAMAADVARISRALIDLQRLLGERDDVDVVWMVQREPSLLGAPPEAVTERLVSLATADGAAGLDVVKLVEAQPGLLLDDGGAVSPIGGESSEQRQLAWSHGLLGDDDAQWGRRLAELEAYAAAFGDAHVGFRDGDDPALVRWAAKQREEAARGLLAGERRACLEGLGFEFDLEAAEWLRWFNQLRAFKAVEGHCSPMPLAAGSDFLLLNWCAVQRIARRSKVMSPDREAMLEELGFDWSGADALVVDSHSPRGEGTALSQTNPDSFPLLLNLHWC